MKFFVGPYLCFNDQTPVNLIYITLEEDKVTAIHLLPYNSQQAWQTSTLDDACYYIFDGEIAPLEDFALIIKDKSLYKIKRQNQDTVNIVTKLHINDNQITYRISPFHKAVRQELPAPMNQEFNPIVIDIAQFPKNLAQDLWAQYLTNKPSLMPFSPPNEITSSQKPSLNIDWSIEQAMTTLLNPECILLRNSRKKPHLFHLCFWKKGKNWIMHCELLHTSIRRTLGDLPSDTPLINFLNAKKISHSTENINKDLEKGGLINYVSARLWGLSVYQQHRIVDRMTIEDAWPILPQLTKSESMLILASVYNQDPQDLNKELFLYYDNIVKFISPFQLLNLEQEINFYLNSDPLFAIAQNARLKHVWLYISHLLLSANTKLQLNHIIKPVKIPREISDRVIGDALSYELDNEWVEEILGFFTEEVEYFDYDYNTLLYFQFVLQNMLLQNPRYLFITEWLKADGENNDSDTTIRVKLNDLEEYIKIYERISNCEADSYDLTYLKSKSYKYNEFIILFKNIHLDLYSQLTVLLNNGCDDFYESHRNILTELLNQVGTKAKQIKIIELLSAPNITRCIPTYEKLTEYKDFLDNSVFEALLDKLKSLPNKIPFQLDIYINLFNKIDNEDIRKTYIAYAKPDLSRTLEQIDNNQLSCIKNMSLTKFNFLVKYLSREEIFNLLQHSNFFLVLGFFKQYEATFCNYFIDCLKPSYFIFLQNSLTFPDFLAAISDEQFDIVHNLVKRCIENATSFWYYFQLLPTKRKLRTLRDEDIQQKWVNSLENILKCLDLAGASQESSILLNLNQNLLKTCIVTHNDFLTTIKKIDGYSHLALISRLSFSYVVSLHNNLDFLATSCTYLSNNAALNLMNAFTRDNRQINLLPYHGHHDLPHELLMKIYQIYTQIKRYQTTFELNQNDSSSRPYSSFDPQTIRRTFAILQTMLIHPEDSINPPTIAFYNQSLNQVYSEIVNLNLRIFSYLANKDKAQQHAAAV